MNILIPDDYQSAVAQLACTQLLAGHSLNIVGDIRQVKNTDALLADTDGLVLIRERTHVDSELLKKMPRLRLISQTGPVGRHIDIDACNAAGVAVMQGTGSPYAAAELTWLLIMSACRRFYEAVEAFRQGDWQVNIGNELQGKTLGILGFGRIGRLVAQYGQAFAMQVQVWGSEHSRAEAVKAGYRACASQEAFFASSDVVSVHLRLNEQTRGFIRLADLLQMKESAVFVNTGRAELVENGTLESALRQGHPGYAAVDVYEAEPIYGGEHPLMALPNALCTPHLGYVAQQSYETYFRSAFNHVLQFAAGDYSAVINPKSLRVR